MKKPEQDTQGLSLSKRSKQAQLMTSDDTDDFAELKNRGLDLRPLWRLIQRNVLLITGVTTVVAAAGLYSALTSPRIYEGDFRLLVEPITSEGKSTDPSVISRNRGDATSIGVDYPSLLQILQSPGLLSAIAKQIQIRYPDVKYESLSKDLVVQRVGTNLADTTKLIEVRYQGADPEKVQFVLEEVAKAYLKYSLENRKTRIGAGVQFIEDQLPGLQQRVDNLQLQLQAFQQRYKLSDPGSEGTTLANQVREIAAFRQTTQRTLQEQKSLYSNLQRQLGLAPKEALAASTLSENPRYQDLLGQLKKIESEIAVESARFKEDSPSIQTLREKQKNLSLLLNQEAQRILGQKLPSTTGNSPILNFQNSTRVALIRQLVDTANLIQVLEVRSQGLARAEALLNQKVKQFPAIIRQYNELQRSLEIATTTLNQLLTQRETLRVEASQKELPWEVVSQPSIQRDDAGNPKPAPLNSAKKLVTQVIAGFLLGLGAAALKEKYRNVFYTTEDIQNALKSQILGVIPFDKSAKQFTNSRAVVGSSKETEANDSDASLFQEAFKSLYANMRFLAYPPVHSLVVGSAAPGDGKTTIALHLAQAAAAMGQRVLLVDANLRLPELHIRLGLSNQLGLSNLLSEDCVANELIQRSPLEDNLFVLTSGQLLPNSTSLLASPKMQHLMEQFKTAFNLVIYDAPQLLGIADANFLVDHTDGVLMVVGLRKTNVSEVMQVMNGLNTFRLRILGVVANHLEESTKSSYGYHNRYYEQKHQVPHTAG